MPGLVRLVWYGQRRGTCALESGSWSCSQGAWMTAILADFGMLHKAKVVDTEAPEILPTIDLSKKTHLNSKVVE